MTVRAPDDVYESNCRRLRIPLPVAYCLLLHFELTYFCYLHFYNKDKNSVCVLHRHHHLCKLKFFVCLLDGTFVVFFVKKCKILVQFFRFAYKITGVLRTAYRLKTLNIAYQMRKWRHSLLCMFHPLVV